ncbi:odve25 [Lambdina fiscellaria nucleopolyhedrovirus]|uniref:Odve25 n=1 Tax=Lambdina fiscellaria nucleopolyhedrovirus TaxID=1642929 RepID=A0A0E3Z8A2_9ABAC|nr:odve25 [Lambdina fiscellaria nucleopolyhedrovirus]AKC91683.1 odve25 [Lambdina fiscellaria nucleopolyhedrovirus]
MIGTIILILVVLAVVYFLSVNNKLNLNSLTDSSPSVNDSSDSVHVDDRTGQYSVKLSAPKLKSIRVLHDTNKLSKVYIAERPLSYSEIIDEGNRSVGANCVFLGTISDNVNVSNGNGASTSSRVTANFDIKQHKNLFIVFKNLENNKIKENVNMVRYESEGMVYALIDSNASSVPELRDVSYPIAVYTTNSAVQLKLIEWSYRQVNDSGTFFIKNETSFKVE